MSREKVLAFLNLKTSETISKSGKQFIRLCLVFEIAFSLSIVVLGFLYQCFSFSVFDVIFISLFIISDIILFIKYKLVRKPTCEITTSMLNMLFATFKLFVGYAVLSDREYILHGHLMFTWVHVAVFAVFVLLGLYVIVRFIKVYNNLKNNSLDTVVKTLNKNNKTPKWVIVLACISPYMLVKLFRGIYLTYFGVGFALWGLGCAWLCVTLFFVPKFIVLKKYGVEDWFE